MPLPVVCRPFGTFSRVLKPHQLSDLKTSKPYNLEVVTELTMYGAALTERSPPVRRDRRGCPGLIDIALSVRFFVLDTAAGGKTIVE